MKKRFFYQISFTLLVLCFMLFVVSSEAYAIETISLGVKNEDVLISRELSSGVKLTKSYITTQNRKGVWNDQTYQWLDFSNTYTGTTIVSWTMSNPDRFKQGTIRDMAYDFEKNNPGWIVVAGVNGGSFDNRSAIGTYEPTNMNLQNGDMVVADSQAYVDGNDGMLKQGVIGWNKDGSTIVGCPTVGGYQVQNLTTGKNIDAACNSVSGSYGTSFFTTGLGTQIIASGARDYVGADVDLTGYTVYLGRYTLSRITNEGNVFVKGTIEAVADVMNLKKVEAPYFYVATKDQASEIHIGDTIRCQRILTGDWANVYNAVGTFVTQVEGDNQVYNVDDDSFHPRTILGFKADGSFVMMVVDGRAPKVTDRRYGVTLSEEGQLMKNAGCVSAYNMDGGGSSELIVREQDDSFSTINTPSDGTSRSDGNAVFIVTKDPGFSLSNTESTRRSITIHHSLDLPFSSDVSNIQVRIGDVTKSMTGDSLVFDGLEEDKEYTIHVSYDILDDNKVKTGDYVLIGKTKAFEKPESGLSITSASKTSLTIGKEESDTSSWIQNVKVNVSGTVYNMGNENTFVIPGLIADTEYTVSFSYDIVEPMYGMVYPIVEDEFVAKTTNYEIPTITSFIEYKVKESSLVVKYAYDDPDTVVKEAYILSNEDKHALTTESGRYEIENFDLTQCGYTVKLVVVYHDEASNTDITIESEALTYEKKVVTPDPTPDPDPDPTPDPDPDPTPDPDPDPTPTPDPTPDPEPTPTPEPEKKKSGCKKSSVSEILGFLTILGACLVLIKKKEN
jgi:hypothetical protein